DCVLRDRDTTGNGTLDERLYALQDANWNVTSIVSASGAVQERFAYSAYGEPMFLNSIFVEQASSSRNWERLFAGYWWDLKVKLYNVRNRVFNSSLGWETRDPLSCQACCNLYIYMEPIDLVDPMGLDPYLRCVFVGPSYTQIGGDGEYHFGDPPREGHGGHGGGGGFRRPRYRYYCHYHCYCNPQDGPVEEALEIPRYASRTNDRRRYCEQQVERVRLQTDACNDDGDEGDDGDDGPYIPIIVGRDRWGRRRVRRIHREDWRGQERWHPRVPAPRPETVRDVGLGIAASTALYWIISVGSRFVCPPRNAFVFVP
ncbi:MAG: hypothetical protein HKN32_05915, partial [Flavobacteriales bacterium]|nr:hypothetical protein [Flavobacteriales bacterium]